MKVIFAIPSHTGEIDIRTVISLDDARTLLDKENIQHDTIYLIGKRPISSARNQLAYLFMQIPEATDLFYIDVDISFSADAVLKLLSRHEKVIAGAYPQKIDTVNRFAVNMKTEDNCPVGRDGLIEAEGLPGGFLRIKRIVIERMYEAYADLRYFENDQWNYDIFGCYVSDGKLWGEDFSFCKRWRNIGGQLWIYPDIDFTHTGKKEYQGNLHKYLLNRSKQEAKCIIAEK